MSATTADYQREIYFVKRKAPTLNIIWQVKVVPQVEIEQLITSAMSNEEATSIYNKYVEAFKSRSGLRLPHLVKLLETDKKAHLFRVIISIKWLREIFANELADWDQGGGGRGLRQDAIKPMDPTSTTMRRR